MTVLLPNQASISAAVGGKGASSAELPVLKQSTVERSWSSYSGFEVKCFSS